MSENSLRKFVDGLVEEVDLDLPPDEMEEYKQKLTQQLQRRLGLISLDHLGDEDLADYEELLDKDPESEDIRKFFSSRIDNYEQKVTQALKEFSQEYIESIRS